MVVFYEYDDIVHCPKKLHSMFGKLYISCRTDQSPSERSDGYERPTSISVQAQPPGVMDRTICQHVVAYELN